ncbi:hypothetical protein BBP40_004006 [Aspergillus hancockii]|nr:hypothetical protein BBP40_004006 [Aspergillus hancockii]
MTLPQTHDAAASTARISIPGSPAPSLIHTAPLKFNETKPNGRNAYMSTDFLKMTSSADKHGFYWPFRNNTRHSTDRITFIKGSQSTGQIPTASIQKSTGSLNPPSPGATTSAIGNSTLAIGAGSGAANVSTVASLLVFLSFLYFLWK